MGDVQMKTYNAGKKSAPVFHPDVCTRIAEVENSNKESLLAGRGGFDRVFGRQLSEYNSCRKGTFLFSFTQSGHQTEYITVLDQNSVKLNIKCKPANESKEYKKQRKLFDCSECDFNCWWDYIMIRHVRKTHSKGNLYVCAHCDFYCLQKYFYDLHVLENHRNSLALYSCNKCDFVASKRGVLKQHTDKHGEEKLDRSHGVGIMRQKLLNTKKQIHSSGKLYVCSFCDYQTKNKGHLQTHEMIHTGEKPFSCTFCDYRSNHKNDIPRHIKVMHKPMQISEKPYTCSFCDYQALYKSELNTHELTHTGEKPYLCTICEYSSRYKSDVTRHIKKLHKSKQIHKPTQTTEKPFACSFCDYRTGNKSHLTAHELIHTGEKPFSCTFCEYQCRQKCHLNVHIRSIHKSTQNC